MTYYPSYIPPSMSIIAKTSIYQYIVFSCSIKDPLGALPSQKKPFFQRLVDIPDGAEGVLFRPFHVIQLPVFELFFDVTLA